MVSATTLVYNPKLVKKPPTSWLDIADPAYAGKYAIGDISGTAGLQFLLALNKLKGGTLEDITPGIEAIKPIAQGATVLYTQADQLLSLFEREEIAIAPWYPDRAGVAIDKGLSLAVAYPKEGAVGILPAVIIPKGTSKTELALKFLDQILSAEGQSCFSGACLYRRGQHQGEAVGQGQGARAQRREPAEDLVHRSRDHRQEYGGVDAPVAT